MEVKPGVAFISDIAVHHAEVLYGSGSPTPAALCDLAEICQAAVLNDTLAVSPVAYHGSTLLQQLEFVPDPTPTVEEIPPDRGVSDETERSQETIVLVRATKAPSALRESCRGPLLGCIDRDPALSSIKRPPAFAEGFFKGPKSRAQGVESAPWAS